MACTLLLQKQTYKIKMEIIMFSKVGQVLRGKGHMYSSYMESRSKIHGYIHHHIYMYIHDVYIYMHIYT
jgi:hypothetical protein